MSDSISRLPARPSLEQLRKQAKELLRDYRAGDETASKRVQSVCKRLAEPATGGEPSLADAQFVLAREHGFENWSNLVRFIEALQNAVPAQFERLAHDYVAAFRGDLDALARLNDLYGRAWSIDDHRKQVQKRVGALLAPTDSTAEFTQSEARLLIARESGFEDWTQLTQAAANPGSERRSAPLGLSTRPPYYRIDWKENLIEPRPPLTDADWDTIIAVMKEHEITGIDAQQQMTDAALERLSHLDHVTRISMDGSNRVTDEGLRCLAHMPQLEQLTLCGYHSQITDAGLTVLQHLGGLKRLKMCWPQRVTDAGMATLKYCEHLENVDLLGTPTGDGAIRALAGKPNLRSFKSGEKVSDAGMALLHELPVFKAWRGCDASIGMMAFNPNGNFLLLRGSITDRGMAHLAGLEGLFAINLDNSKLAVTAAGLAPLSNLPNLGWLGFDATDEAMPHIAAMPRLRMLMCQDTMAGDAGFAALSRSRSIEYIWGRRCYNLRGPGFQALSAMPSLRGLVVSCKNVDDKALSVLPEFPALKEFMPMDVPDEGFRHVGRSRNLEDLWCMYCTDTGDAATAHIAGLPRLKSYSAFSSQITDRSLEILGKMSSLERLHFEHCAALSDAGLPYLAGLPRLREISVEGSPLITRRGATLFPANVRVAYLG